MSWEKVGEIGVDAGVVWIGDPCYILHKKKLPKTLGENWGDFCALTSGKDAVSFGYEAGHEGLGIMVETAYGDGSYPVEIKRNSEGRISEVRVKFE